MKHLHITVISLLIAWLIAVPVLGVTQQEKLNFLYAVSIGNLGLVKTLLDKAGNHTIDLLTATGPPPYKNTPLHLAAQNDHTETVKELLNRAGNQAIDLITATNQFKITPFHYAAGTGSTKTVKELLNRAGNQAIALLTATGDWGCTPLHGAAGSGCIETVKELLNRAGNQAIDLLTAIGCLGFIPIHCAVGDGHTEIVKELLNKAGNQAIKLLTATTIDGYTPLHGAVHDGHTETVEELLNRGANPHMRNNLRQTPEELARQRGMLATAQVLANWSQQSIEKRTQELEQALASIRNLAHTTFPGGNMIKIAEYLLPREFSRELSEKILLEEQYEVIRKTQPKSPARQAKILEMAHRDKKRAYQQAIEEQRMLEHAQIEEAQRLFYERQSHQTD